MNHANISKSDRLQRTLAVLRQGPATTMDIIQRAKVCAVNSIISELRANGYDIDCNMTRRDGSTIAIYRLRGGAA